jgi:protein-disulfide isomerase
MRLQLPGLVFGCVISVILGLSPFAFADPDARFAEHVLGDPKARVRIDEYASLGCPHCAAFENDELPKLKADYIDKRKAYLVFHDVPIWEIATKAAMLTHCVPSERYYPMIETLYRLQSVWTGQRTETGQLETLKQQAKFAGLSNDQINSCLADRTVEDGVLQEQLDSSKAPLNVSVTPTFILNGDPKNRVETASYNELKAKIDALLK